MISVILKQLLASDSVLTAPEHTDIKCGLKSDMYELCLNFRIAICGVYWAAAISVKTVTSTVVPLLVTMHAVSSQRANTKSPNFSLWKYTMIFHTTKQSMSLNVKMVFEMFCFITKILYMVALLTVSCVGLKVGVQPQLYPDVHSYGALYFRILQLKMEAEWTIQMSQHPH